LPGASIFFQKEAEVVFGQAIGFSRAGRGIDDKNLRGFLHA